MFELVFTHSGPGAANPASMPGCPLRRTCARPHEGAYTATASEAAYRPAWFFMRAHFPVGAVECYEAAIF